MEGEGDRRCCSVHPTHLPSGTQQEALNLRGASRPCLGSLDLAGTCVCANTPLRSSESPSVRRGTSTYVHADTGVHEHPTDVSASACKWVQDVPIHTSSPTEGLLEVHTYTHSCSDSCTSWNANMRVPVFTHVHTASKSLFTQRKTLRQEFSCK